MKYQKNKLFTSGFTKIFLIIVLFLIFLTWFLFNIINNKTFFDASLHNLLSIFCVIFISYFLVQQDNNRRRVIDKISRLVNSIQELIEDEDFGSFETEQEQIKQKMIQRTIINRIIIMKELAENIKYSSDVEKNIEELENEFKRYREFYGEHYTSKEYMKESINDIHNYVNKMDSLCDRIYAFLM